MRDKLEARADAPKVGAAPRSPGSQALFGLEQIELFMLSPLPCRVRAPAGSRSKLAIRRMSMAKARLEGLADLSLFAPVPSVLAMPDALLYGEDGTRTGARPSMSEDVCS